MGMLLLNGELQKNGAEQAVQLLSRSAAQGNEEAMLQLGLCYLSGDGVPEDAEKAFSVFEKAAQSGNAEAVNMLGRCYMDGTGVAQDQKKAFELFQKAAADGHAAAAYNLGDCYFNGLGTELDEKKAVEWYQKSAEQGVPIAQYLLGTCYHFGRGLPQDEKLAQEWLEKAAKQDYRDAQYALGMCLYYQEVTSEAEDSQAVYWFQKAAEQGDIPSKCQLGICYLDGNGVKRDTKYALRLFREAAMPEMQRHSFSWVRATGSAAASSRIPKRRYIGWKNRQSRTTPMRSLPLALATRTVRVSMRISTQPWTGLNERRRWDFRMLSVPSVHTISTRKRTKKPPCNGFTRRQNRIMKTHSI